MKAIVVRQFGDPEVLRLEEVPDPKAGAGQVVVKVRAVGVNPVEAYVRSGTYAAKPNLPYTPGADAAGEIIEVGSGVTRFKPGDRVYAAATGAGTYAEQVAVSEGQVHPLSDNVTFEQGAAMGVPYATAYRALFQRGNAKAAETLLVHGATGGVGTAAVQLASAAGLVVIGTAGSEKGMQLVKEQGARHALNHSIDGYLDELKKLTDGRGVDLIAEMLANKNLAKDLGVLAKKGRVVVIGNRGTVEINPRDAMGKGVRYSRHDADGGNRSGVSRNPRRIGRWAGERYAAAGGRPKAATSRCSPRSPGDHGALRRARQDRPRSVRTSAVTDT